MNEHTNIEALGLTTRGKELVFEFFWLFARFEYALKRSGYLQERKNDQAWPDWTRFTDELSKLSDDSLAPVFKAGMYLRDHPPRRQAVVDKTLVWKDRGPSTTDTHALLGAVKTVRNNLFHGGKCPYAPVNEPSRNEDLVQGCSSVLRALLAIDQPPCSNLRPWFEVDA